MKPSLKLQPIRFQKNHPDYQYLAARLAVFHLRKKAYGQFEPPRLFDHVTKMVGDKRYDAHLLADYTEQEIDELDEYLRSQP